LVVGNNQDYSNSYDMTAVAFIVEYTTTAGDAVSFTDDNVGQSEYEYNVPDTRLDIPSSSDNSSCNSAIETGSMLLLICTAISICLILKKRNIEGRL
jgi:hypothetical protein